MSGNDGEGRRLLPHSMIDGAAILAAQKPSFSSLPPPWQTHKVNLSPPSPPRKFITWSTADDGERDRL